MTTGNGSLNLEPTPGHQIQDVEGHWAEDPIAGETLFLVRVRHRQEH